MRLRSLRTTRTTLAAVAAALGALAGPAAASSLAAEPPAFVANGNRVTPIDTESNTDRARRSRRVGARSSRDHAERRHRVRDRPRQHGATPVNRANNSSDADPGRRQRPRASRSRPTATPSTSSTTATDRHADRHGDEHVRRRRSPSATTPHDIAITPDGRTAVRRPTAPTDTVRRSTAPTTPTGPVVDLGRRRPAGHRDHARRPDRLRRERRRPT